MKVLIVNDCFHDIAGAEAYSLNLCAGLRTKGVDVAGFCARTDGVEEGVPYPLHHADRLPFDTSWRVSRLFNPLARKALANVIASEKPNLIHFQNVLSRLSVAVLGAAAGIPTVMTVHDYRFDCSQSKLDKEGLPCPHTTKYGIRSCLVRGCAPPHHFLYQSLRNLAVRRTIGSIRALIAPSRFMQRYLMSVLGVGPEYIPHGIDGARFSNTTPPGDRVILYVGRLVPEKGVSTLIAAMGILAHAYPNARLRILGDGPSKGSLKAEAESVPGGMVEFVGKVPNADVPAQYVMADVICMPSLWPDNAPIVAYESMAAGRALVASNVGGLPDLVEDHHTGRLVPPGDADALAAALAETLDGRSAEYGRAARGKFEREFTLERHIDAVQALYTRLLAAA